MLRLHLQAAAFISNYRPASPSATATGPSTDPSIPRLQVVWFSERLGLAHQGRVGGSTRLSELTEARFPPCNGERLHSAPDKHHSIEAVARSSTVRCVTYRLSELTSEWPGHTAAAGAINRDTWGLEASVGSFSLWLETAEARVGVLPFGVERAAESLGRKLVFIGVSWHHTWLLCLL